VPFDLEVLEVTGVPVTVVKGVTTLPMWATAAFDLSPEGSLVYAPGDAMREEQHLLWVDRQGRSSRLTETPHPFQGQVLGLSPDNATLAVTMGGANNSIWVYDLSRGMLQPLASGFDNGNSIWTPDGRYVTFSGPDGIFRRRPDASAPAEQLVDRGTQHSWSPDGKILAFGKNGDLWMLRMEGTREEEVLLQTNADERYVAISPNGRWFAYQSDANGRNEIYLQSFPEPGQKQQVSTDGGRQPLWNPRGGELFYRNGPEMLAVGIGT
jgi:Tol biopolymer transport system component